MGVRIGIDIGATRLKSAIVENNEILDTDTVFLSPQDHEEAGLIALLDKRIRHLSKQHQIEAVGIGVAGVIDTKSGLIRQSPNFPVWSDFALGKRLSDVIGLPVAVDNDANMVALGEYEFGAGKGSRSMILLTLGSGVGGGLILDSKLFHGERGMAGEIGHITVDPEGFACNCGNNGCLEQYASAKGLRNMVERDNFFGKMTKSALKDPKLPEKLYKIAKNGDERALRYFEDFGYYLAIALGGVLNLLNVKTIVFSGGVARSMDLWEDVLRQELTRRTFAAVLEDVRIEQGTLGDMAGALGAARLFDT